VVEVTNGKKLLFSKEDDGKVAIITIAKKYTINKSNKL
jgi:hypothetical protein